MSSREYIKASLPLKQTKKNVSDIVQDLLDDVELNKEDAVIELAQKFDNWTGAVVVSQEAIDAACDLVSDSVKSDIKFAYANVKKFAEAQLTTLKEIQIEVIPGLICGQKNIPVNCCGAYVPGGRYCHIASAIMTITTAKVAGVKHVTACTVPKVDYNGIDPVMLYTMSLCGASTILALGGVQAIGAMAFGLFGCPQADVIVGPGNQYVAEAKRQLSGTHIGMDMVAGPTESMIIADDEADPKIVAVDLVGQAEHGYNSPIWLVTSSRELANAVLTLIPSLIQALPQPNLSEAEAAWRDHGEVILCGGRDEMINCANEYAPEHLQVLTRKDELSYYLDNLNAYGSLFLGEETTVAYGDKCSGPNHVLPTNKAARYSGGLSVHKFLKLVTYQQATTEASKALAQTTARISRLEGMEGHARSADVRLEKYFPSEIFQLGK